MGTMSGDRSAGFFGDVDYNTGEGLKGAAGGALAGASVGGPVGALVGGGLGLLGGFWNNQNPQDQKQRQLMDAYYQEAMNRQAPQMGPAAQGQYSGFRQNQSGLISRLEAMANGTGPSLARQQFEQATDRNMRGQQAMAASGRGGPLSQLTAANNMSMLGANAAQGSALARTNEQMGAIGQLGGVIAQGRGADEGMNMFNAGQQNDVGRANLDARLRTMGMNDAVRTGLLGQQFQLNQAQANRPTFGDQLLAGGAGMFSMGATQNAQMGASNKPQAGMGGGLTNAQLLSAFQNQQAYQQPRAPMQQQQTTWQFPGSWSGQ